MNVSEFLLGVLSTLSVELIALIITAFNAYIKRK